MLFRRDMVKALPSKVATDLSPEIATMWKLAPKEVRDKYARLAEEERNKHALMYPSYKFTPKKRGTGKQALKAEALKAAAKLAAMNKPLNLSGSPQASRTKKPSKSQLSSKPKSKIIPSTLNILKQRIRKNRCLYEPYDRMHRKKKGKVPVKSFGEMTISSPPTSPDSPQDLAPVKIEYTEDTLDIVLERNFEPCPQPQLQVSVDPLKVKEEPSLFDSPEPLPQLSDEFEPECLARNWEFDTNIQCSEMSEMNNYLIDTSLVLPGDISILENRIPPQVGIGQQGVFILFL
ncbi:hypothetical protein BGZ76_010204 [Entomortierella beljakovae]|nr:hypothetical protein BGZ76_010204 [Entomortierella beljakovae]